MGENKTDAFIKSMNKETQNAANAANAAANFIVHEDAIPAIVDETIQNMLAAKTSEEVDAAYKQARGQKNGSLTLLMEQGKTLTADAKKNFYNLMNDAKKKLDDEKEQILASITKVETEAKLEAERVDVSLPARAESAGRLHPISQTIDELIEIFAQMGFTVASGPQIESDDYNFTKLNVPPDHPARQMQDTFYMPDAADGSKRVLRTQTSPVQVRTMLQTKPPIRIIAPGRVYRYDSDATHSPMFHQVEGLVIDEIGKITMAHLKGTLLDFYRAYFGVTDLPIRFRPSFFPFTEPSAEFDIGCSRKAGEIKIGNFGDWLEVGGCGMVHPKVLENCGIDPTKYQGFAFGLGLDRAAMLKYGIPDIRNFFEGDIRWMKHYGFIPFDVASLAQGSVA